MTEEESNIETEDIQRDNETDENNLWSQLLHFLSVMTIEPMLFFQFLGFSIIGVAQSQMILYKTCRGKINYILVK